MSEFALKTLNSQKHRKDLKYQRSYKGKSTAQKSINNAEAGEHSNAKKPTQSKLPSNWEKYEKNIDDMEIPLHALEINFNTLTLLPSSNSQFQLKQDKVFMPRNDCSFNLWNVFDLDMNLIGLSLATIPYHKRLNIDKAILTENELLVINRNAVDANAEYHAYLGRQTCASDSDHNHVSEEDAGSADEVELRTDDMECKELPPIAQDPNESEKKELEDWLNKLL